jgi:hypothetical protein
MYPGGLGSGTRGAGDDDDGDSGDDVPTRRALIFWVLASVGDGGGEGKGMVLFGRGYVRGLASRGICCGRQRGRRRRKKSRGSTDNVVREYSVWVRAIDCPYIYRQGKSVATAPHSKDMDTHASRCVL